MAFADSVNNFKASFTAPLAEKVAKPQGWDRLLKHTQHAEGFWAKTGGLIGDTVKAPFRLVAMGSGAVAKGSLNATGWAAGKTASGVGAVALKPVEGVLNISGATVRGVRAHPVLAGAAAAIGLGGYIAHRSQANAEARTQAELMAQMNAPLPQQTNPYMLQPGEFTANVAPKMRDSMADGTPVVGGHAEKIANARAAAAAQPEAPTADLAAL